jgi:hypothetical protein
MSDIINLAARKFRKENDLFDDTNEQIHKEVFHALTDIVLRHNADLDTPGVDQIETIIEFVIDWAIVTVLQFGKSAVHPPCVGERFVERVRDLAAEFTPSHERTDQ